MNSGSSADTTWTWTFSNVAAPAVGDSTADDTVVHSVDSSTEEDKAKPSSSAAFKVTPKARNLSRASMPPRPTSLYRGQSRAMIGEVRRQECQRCKRYVWWRKKRTKGREHRTEYPNLDLREVRLRKDHGVRPRCMKRASHLRAEGLCLPRRRVNLRHVH